jgi:hypothetical protein
MTGGVIGWQMWFVIAIDPDYADDEGLYQHELTHVKQWAAVTLATGVVLGLIYMPLILCAPSIHAALYRFVRRYVDGARQGPLPSRRSFTLTTGR